MKEIQERDTEKRKITTIEINQKDIENIEAIVEKDQEVGVWKDRMEEVETYITMVEAQATQE